MSATSNFKAAVKKAKRLYKTGRYKTFADAVKAAYKKKKVGSVAKKNRQTGKTTRIADAKRKAKRPGKRKSASGRTYYERRKNRSDVPGTLTGTVSSHVSAAKKLLADRIAHYEKMKFIAQKKSTKRLFAKKISEAKKQYNRL